MPFRLAPIDHAINPTSWRPGGGKCASTRGRRISFCKLTVSPSKWNIPCPQLLPTLEQGLSSDRPPSASSTASPRAPVPLLGSAIAAFAVSRVPDASLKTRHLYNRMVSYHNAVCSPIDLALILILQLVRIMYPCKIASSGQPPFLWSRLVFCTTS